MDRRMFLKTLGLAAGSVTFGGLVAACGDGAGGIPDNDPALNVINASFETLTGEGRRFAFGLTDLANQTQADRDLEVYLRSIEGQEIIAGPETATYHDDTGAALGVYLTRFDVTEAGPVELVVVDGDTWGTAIVNVVRPEDSAVPVPGDEAISVATPTTEDDLGIEEVCTDDPDCGMHEASLDDVLAEGRPAILLFATPAYCQTAVCGPAVGTVDGVRDERDWGDLAFLHLEIFSDAGQTVTDWVREWGLPSEPWLFAVDANGQIVDRVDGPMIRDVVVEVAESLTGGSTGS